MKSLLALAIAASLLAGCANLDAEARKAVDAGDFDKAEALYTEAIRRGDSAGWNNIGVLYERRGDRAAAVRYYTIAARHGNAIAQRNLANLGEPIPSADLAAQRAQQRTADTANTLLLLQALQPRPAPPIQPDVHCTSQRFGNTVQTRCN